LFLAKHHRIVEVPECADNLKTAHMYLLQFTRIHEREILKICLEYWHIIVTSLYIEMNIQQPADDISNALNGLGFEDQNGDPVLPKQSPAVIRKASYGIILTELREVIVEQMAKPAEASIIRAILFYGLPVV
jgi:exportin-1